jgi:hypothetical protein
MAAATPDVTSGTAPALQVVSSCDSVELRFQIPKAVLDHSKLLCDMVETPGVSYVGFPSAGVFMWLAHVLSDKKATYSFSTQANILEVCMIVTMVLLSCSYDFPTSGPQDW